MAELTIACGGCLFSVSGDTLRVSQEGAELVSLRVAPVIEGRPTELEPWSGVSSEHLAAEVAGRDATVHLEIDHGLVSFRMSTAIGEFDRLHYLTHGRIAGEGWQTYLSDVNDCFRSTEIDAEVPISSCFNGLTPDPADGEGMTDPGDNAPTWIWNIPIRAFSLRTPRDWLGVSIPGPLPVGVTRLAVKDRLFSLLFEKLRPSCVEGAMPRLYFLTGLPGPYDALEGHRDLSARLGWMASRAAEQPRWWASPTYKPAVDLFATGQKGVLYRDENGAWASRFTTATFRSWVDGFMTQARITDAARVLLDQIFLYGYGSRRIIKELGEARGLRELIDELRARNIHVGPYFHPYFIGEHEPFSREHPECFCKPKDAGVTIHWCDMDTLTPAYVDWTHPETRRRQMDYLEFLLSEAPGCLNASWLALNNAEGPDPRKYDFHDPDWAIGDLLQFKVHRLIYERAKRIKPDCLVRRIAAGDCYLQPFIDQIELMEHWMSGTEEWYKRGQIITRASRDVLFGTDPYFLTQTKGREYWMAMMAWNTPEYGGLDRAIHPYNHWRDLPEKDRRRRTAGIQAYLNAPMNRTDACRVTWEHGALKEAWRRRTSGPLEGFYAALALSPRCVVTYSERCARAASSESRYANVPLPPRARVSGVVRVLHEGGEEPLAFDRAEGPEGPMVQLKVADCGFETLYTEIRYELSRANPSLSPG